MNGELRGNGFVMGIFLSPSTFGSSPGGERRIRGDRHPILRSFGYADARRAARGRGWLGSRRRRRGAVELTTSLWPDAPVVVAEMSAA